MFLISLVCYDEFLLNFYDTLKIIHQLLNEALQMFLSSEVNFKKSLKYFIYTFIYQKKIS